MVPILVKNCELDLTKWQDCHRWCGDEVDCGKTGVTSVDFMEEVMGVEIILVQKYCGAIIFFGSHRNCYIFVHDCVQRLWALSLWRGCFPWPLHVMSRCRGICLSKIWLLLLYVHDIQKQMSCSMNGISFEQIKNQEEMRTLLCSFTTVVGTQGCYMDESIPLNIMILWWVTPNSYADLTLFLS